MPVNIAHGLLLDLGTFFFNFKLRLICSEVIKVVFKKIYFFYRIFFRDIGLFSKNIAIERHNEEKMLTSISTKCKVMEQRVLLDKCGVI